MTAMHCFRVLHSATLKLPCIPPSLTVGPFTKQDLRIVYKTECRSREVTTYCSEINAKPLLGRSQCLEKSSALHFDQALRQLIDERDSSIGLADNSRAPRILLICTAIKTIRRRFIFRMGRQDVDPSFRLPFAGITVALGCVECGLLMCVLLSVLPWLISVACVLMLVVPFMFIAS